MGWTKAAGRWRRHKPVVSFGLIELKKSGKIDYEKRAGRLSAMSGSRNSALLSSDVPSDQLFAALKNCSMNQQLTLRCFQSVSMPNRAERRYPG
jgi:hypothetical protein